MRLLFDYADSGNYLRILSPYMDINKEADVSGLYEIFSLELYQVICRALNEDKKVFVPKDIPPEELAEANLLISMAESSLEKEKNHLANAISDTIRVKDFTGNIVSPMFRFIQASFNLFANGYYVTEANDDEIYQKMLSDRNPKAIKAMKEYLTAKVKLEETLKKYETLYSAINKIKEAETLEEVKEIYNNYATEISVGKGGN